MRVGLMLGLLLTSITTGCVDSSRVDKLEKRVATLEAQQAAQQTQAEKQQKADADRRAQLEHCVTVEANEAYTNLIRPNATKTGRGDYSVPQPVLEMAERMRRQKIEECKLLYGK